MGNILIVGASGGIGRETAKQLIAEGHTIFGTYNTNSQPNELNPNINWIHHNTNDSESLNKLLGQLPEELAGIIYAVGKVTLKPFNRITEADFLTDFQTQTLGAALLIQKLIPHLKRNTNGSSVVLCSSVAAQTGFPFHALIGLSKGAIEGLVKSLAAEYAPSIRFNAVAPSITDTALTASFINTEEKRQGQAQKHPLKRIGTATDIANLINFLIGEKSSWITGQVITIDGGISAIR